MAQLFYSFVASVLLAQAVYSQCNYNSNIGWGNNVGLIGNNLGYAGNNIALAGNNLALAGNNLALAGNNFGYGNNLVLAGNGLSNGWDGINNAGIFAAESVSPNYNAPGGVVVTSENQIGGQVAVNGALPFLGSAYFGGDVASGGEGTLTYGAGPSVSLNGGGCGYGLGSGIVGYGIGNIGGASVINSGLGGASIISSGLGINNGLSGGCSCGNGLYW